MSLDTHVIDVDVLGPERTDGLPRFSVRTTRVNPAAVGAVTGKATLASFVSSMVRAVGKGSGYHIC